MNEIRQNKVTKQWVIYATERGKRPQEFRRKEEKKLLPVKDQECPFCPGNEAMLPPILMETSRADGWQTRVVPNKFPALLPEGDADRYEQGIYLAMQGYGRHEVIIESPRHDQQLSQMSPAEVGLIIETYHRRFIDLMKEHQNMMILIFRNHGLRAGTSLIHPHSQVIVTGMVPNYIRWRDEEAQRYFDEWGRCVCCDILRYEAEDRRRVILENETFLAFIPYAAEVPFETWIMPKNHQASFGQISTESKSDLAFALQGILAKLDRKLNDPDYNYILHTSPQYKSDEPQLHWYLQIRPRLTTQAGFEIGSGISINPSLPEENAAFLKKEDV
jgi:UDPglucose--hexose-1-phosphate uridylyltransferase